MTQPPLRRRQFIRLGGRAALAALGTFSLAGCKTLRFWNTPADGAASAAPVPTTPGKNGGVRVSQYVFYADFPLKPSDSLFVELSELRDQIYKELQLPPSNTVVQVFLFEDQEKYEQYMRHRYPDLPKRRAFFIAQPHSRGGVDDLYVYTFWGPHIRQDLRHELTHALLHSVLKDVPLWLDEGLAEFYELPPERNGINAQHVEQMRRATFASDLARLEQLSQVQHMDRAEYREAWAWVHFMLRGKPETRAVLLRYLQQLRGSQSPGSLLARLREVYPSLEDALADHLGQLDGQRPTPAVTAGRR